MKTRMILGAAAAAAAALLSAGAAFAHHSFSMFDNATTTNVAGVVKEVQYTNPHSWLFLTGEDSKVWSFEAGSPNQMTRAGWKKSTVKAGDKVTVAMHPLKSGEPGGAVMSVTFADGTKIGAR